MSDPQGRVLNLFINNRLAPIPFLLFVIFSYLLIRFVPFPHSNNPPKPTSIPTPSVTPTPFVRQWGIFAGSNVSDFTSLKEKISTPPDFLATFVHWGNESEFPIELALLAKENKQTLVIYWEAMDYNHPKPETDSRYSYDQILSGKYDSYIKSFANDVKLYNHPVILIPFEEMNGEWYSWSMNVNGNTPEKHRQAYKYLHRFFKDVPNVKFAWDVNQTRDHYDFTAIYPGDEYVDYVGVNGFNFDNPWESFDDIFNQTLSDLAFINKPLYIFSMASAEGPLKAAWIHDAAQKINSNPRIKGFIWFNENKEKNWLIWSDAESLQAFNDFLLPKK